MAQDPLHSMKYHTQLKQVTQLFEQCGIALSKKMHAMCVSALNHEHLSGTTVEDVSAAFLFCIYFYMFQVYCLIVFLSAFWACFVCLLSACLFEGLLSFVTQRSSVTVSLSLLINPITNEAFFFAAVEAGSL